METPARTISPKNEASLWQAFSSWLSFMFYKRVLSPPCQRPKQRSCRRNPRHGQPRALHRFLDRGFVRANPGVFGIVAGGSVEQRNAFGAFGRFPKGHLQDFGEVQGVAVGFLRDLLATAEAVGDDEPVGGRLANGGGEVKVADGGRGGCIFFFEA